MDHRKCGFCSSLNAYERGFQKGGAGTYLPPTAEDLTFSDDLMRCYVTLDGNPLLRIPSSRLLQLRQCPRCQTFYLYRSNYKYNDDGSEDEQILERLTDEQTLSYLEELDRRVADHAAASQPDALLIAGPEESLFDALERNKNYSIGKLEIGLASGDVYEIRKGLENLPHGACAYLELIPVLERVAAASFYRIVGYGTDDGPHPDLSWKISCKEEALETIENIRENAGLASGSETARALKSNDPDFIKTILESLIAEGVCADQSLIPILTKIAGRNAYHNYTFGGGLKSTYYFQEPAREVIEIILQNYRSDENEENCRLCNMLQNDLKINPERGERFPPAFDRLISAAGSFNSPLRRCPVCGIYFYLVDITIKTKSGGKKGQRLTRLSAYSSLILENLFSNAPQNHNEPEDIAELLKNIPLETLLPIFRKHIYSAPQTITLFIPHLLQLLEQTDDALIRELLTGYAANEIKGEQKILAAFRSASGPETSRFLNLLRRCLTVAGENP